jgi:hypothetical protein
MMGEWSNRYNRRGFLILGATSIAVLVFGKELSAGSGLPSFIANSSAAKNIGVNYARQLDVIPSRSQLIKDIFSGSSKKQRCLFLENELAFKKFVEYKGAEDFKKGRVVNVDGFFLSSTESSICLLVSLDYF